MRQHGGEVDAGSLLGFESDGETVYFTTDGTDPRLPGGELNPNAISYQVGSTIPIDSRIDLFARSLEGGEWSASSEASFRLSLDGIDLTRVRIAEIHYNPGEPTQGGNRCRIHKQ